MKPVHVELAHEGRNVGVLEILAIGRLATPHLVGKANAIVGGMETDARTLENSEVGDMTKLSLLLDQDIKCWIPESSSILGWMLVALPPV